MITILIYEDNHNLRESLVQLISREENLKVIGDFGDCINVEQQVSTYQPDVILMDIDLPEQNGIEGVMKIRKINQKAHILMLTVFEDSELVYKALYSGANGYLLKKYISDRLINSINDVVEGGAPMSPAIARIIVKNLQDKGTHREISEYNLTPREVDVLVSLAKGNSYKMVAEELFISIETVRSHIKNVYAKLHVQSQSEAISKALREGLID